MYATINNVRLYYETHGQGLPVLFIHGFPLSGRLWTPLVEPLSDRCRMIIPDLRGMGRSDSTDEADMRAYADDLAGLLDHLDEKKPVVVVGLSMGGYIAFEFHRRYADRVRALVLADTRANADSEQAARQRLEMIEDVRRKGSLAVAESMIDKLFSRSASPSLRRDWLEIMSSTDPRGVIAALGAIRGRADSTSLLKQMNVPTLIVVGEADVITPPEAAHDMQSAIPNSRLVVIPRTGHMTPVEAPAAFAQVLTSFLDRLNGV